jgi:hypothetical protein
MSDEMDLATASFVMEALWAGVTMTEAERDLYRDSMVTIAMAALPPQGPGGEG